MRAGVSAYALAAMKTWPTAMPRRVWRVRFALAIACGIAVHAAPRDPALSLPPHLADPVAAAWADEREQLASGDAAVRAAANGRLAMFHHAQQLLVEAEHLYSEAIADARLAAGGEAAAVAEAFRWHYLRGVVRRDRGQLDGAVQDFRAALEIHPEHASSHYRLGTLLLDRGDADGATTHLQRALAADARSAAALEALADVAIATQEWWEARGLLERAWQAEPAGRLAYKLAIVERRLGNSQTAERWLARRGRDAPTVHDPLLLEVAALSLNPRFYIEAAANAEARGEVEAALAAYTQATSLAPNDASVGLALARALVRHGRPAAALEESRRILSLDGTPAMALHAGLAMQQGEHAEAERSYAELASAEPEQASHLYWLAMSRLAQGACAKARAPLARALRLAPASGETHLVAARTEALCGNADAALVRARALLRVRDDADTRLTLALALLAVDPLAARRIATDHSGHEDARLILAALASETTPARPFAAASLWWQPPLP